MKQMPSYFISLLLIISLVLGSVPIIAHADGYIPSASTAVQSTYYVVSGSSISSGQSAITTQTTVSQFLGNLVVTSGAAFSVHTSGVSFANPSDYVNGLTSKKADSSTLAIGDQLWVLAENQAALGHYAIDVTTTSLSTDNAVLSTAYQVNSVANTISPASSIMTSETLVANFLANLRIPAKAAVKVLTSAQAGTVVDKITFDTAVGISINKRLSQGDQLVVLSESGAVRKYTLSLTVVVPSPAKIDPAFSMDRSTGVTYPTIKNRLSTSMDLVFLANKNATVRYKLLLETETAPTRDALLASLTFTELTADTLKTVKLTGLSATANYKLYAILIDSAGNTSSLVTRLSDVSELDKTPPKIVTARVSKITANSAVLTMQFDEKGQYNTYQLLASKDQPSSTTMASQKYAPHEANITVQTTYSRLLPGVEYNIWATAKDTSGNSTGVFKAATFKTLGSDSTAPYFESGYPKITVKNTSVTFTCKSNEEATLRYLIQETSKATPAKTSLFKSGITMNLPERAERTENLIKSAGTYTVYMILTDSYNNDSAVVKYNFTTGDNIDTTIEPKNTPDKTTASPEFIKSKEEVIGGNRHTTFILDPAGLMDKVNSEYRRIQSLPKNSNALSRERIHIELMMPTDANFYKKVEVNANTFKQLVDKNVTFDIKSDFGSYNLPAEELKKALTNSVSASASIQIFIKNAEAAVKSSITTALGTKGTMVANPVSFDVLLVDGSKTTEVKNFSQYVSRTITAPNQNMTTALVLGSNGKLYHVPTYVTGNLTAKATASINSTSNSVYTVISNRRQFKDVAGLKYEPMINNMASRYIIEGTSKDTFSPNSEVTRAQFSTMLTRALGLYRGEMGRKTFADNTKVVDLAVGITVAADNGLIKGYANGTVNPNASITSEQLASMLYNASQKFAPVSDSKKNLAKKVSTGTWSDASVVFASSTGMIENFQKNHKVTRAEAAYAIYMLLVQSELINK